MNPFENEDCWLLQDFEVQDEIEIDQTEPNNLILIPQSTLHSEQSHHVAVTADALADASSNEELALPLLDESSNDNSNLGGSTSSSSFSNVLFDGRGMFVPTIFEGVECSEIASEMDGNVYSFLSSPQFQYPEPFQFSLQEHVVTTASIETNCDSTNERSNDNTESKNKSEKSTRSANSVQFVTSWRHLTEKAEKMKDRTGATTCISTVFKDEPFEICTDQTNQTPGRIRSVSNSSGLSGLSSGTSLEEKSDHEAEDDHCYAAVILKQRESSPSVSDHQYNQSSPRKQIKRTSESECFTSEPKLPFFKMKSHRERMLVKYMNSIFLKASKLEAFSGSSIDVKVYYEDHTFTKENIKAANSLLKQRKGQQQLSKLHQRPPVISNTCEEESKNCPTTHSLAQTSSQEMEMESKPQVRVTIFKQPASETAPAGVNVKFIWDKKHSRSSSAIPAGFSNFSLNNGLNNSNEVTTETGIQSFGCFQNEFRNNTEYVVGPQLYNPHPPVFDLNVDEGLDEIGENEKSELSSSPLPLSASCNDHQQEDSNHSTISIRNHFEHEEASAHGKDSETQTEPTCGICWSPRPLNSLTLLTTSSEEVFWIRCAQPLCHFLAHTDCIGFRVSSSAQLLSLPPFHCSHHRN